MQARAPLVVVVLLTLISAPWIGALGPFEDSEVKIQSESYPELNEAQIDAIFNSGAKGVTSWVKQGTANPNALNGPGDVNSVWISDVVNSTNNAVIIAAPTTLSLSPVPIVAMWCSTMVLLRRRGINGPLSWRSWINTEAGRGLWKPGNPRIQWAQLTLSKHRLAPPEFGYAVGSRTPSHSAITP